MNDIEVLINNKRYTLCGYESGEYLQKVASYINSKIAEFNSKESYKRLESDMRNILLDINIADDYFKALSQIRDLEDENGIKNNEIFDMKHELISVQTKVMNLESELEQLKSSYNEAQKEIVKLETELEDIRKQKR